MSEAFTPGWKSMGSYTEYLFDENGRKQGQVKLDNFSRLVLASVEGHGQIGAYYDVHLARAAVERAVSTKSMQLPEKVQAVIDAARLTQHRIINTTDREVGPQIVAMLAPLHKAISDLDEKEQAR